ncbi:MAG: AAA family ATPase [Candidatus Saccharimonadales bacterium]
MARLVVHATTKQHLDRAAQNPAHALLLLGADGVGKGGLAGMLASALLGVTADKLYSYPYFKTVEATNGTISIDAVRDVQKSLQLKTVGTRPIRRIICIEHADGLTHEAQNALLKLLEEPPADTVVILTAQHKRALLPTILSRVQTLPILPPTQAQLTAHFSGHSSDSVRKAYFLSGGLPGLMQGILTDSQDHPLLEQVATAKELLQKPAFERLAMVDSLAKQKDSLPPLLDALERIAHSGLTQAGKASGTKQIAQWHLIQKQVFAAKEALGKNANAKLVLANLFLNF